MILKGRVIKPEEKLLPNTMYIVRKSREVEFVEEKTNDIVEIQYCLEKEQYGAFCHEFMPGYISKEGYKKADLLILVVDEEKKKFASWVLDVKKSVGGEDVIFKLIQQLIDSRKHKNSIAAYFEDYEEQEHLGFITRDFQKERVESTIRKKKNDVDEESQIVDKVKGANGFKIKRNILKTEKEVEILEKFLEDRIVCGKETVPIFYYPSERMEDCAVCKLEVKIV